MVIKHHAAGYCKRKGQWLWNPSDNCIVFGLCGIFIIGVLQLATVCMLLHLRMILHNILSDKGFQLTF